MRLHVYVHTQSGHACLQCVSECSHTSPDIFWDGKRSRSGSDKEGKPSLIPHSQSCCRTKALAPSHQPTRRANETRHRLTRKEKDGITKAPVFCSDFAPELRTAFAAAYLQNRTYPDSTTSRALRAQVFLMIFHFFCR